MVVRNVARVDQFQFIHFDDLLHFGLFDSKDYLLVVLVDLEDEELSWVETGLFEDCAVGQGHLDLKVQ